MGLQILSFLMADRKIPDELIVKSVDRVEFKEFIVEELRSKSLEKFVYSQNACTGINVKKSASSKTLPIVNVCVSDDYDDFERLIDFFESFGYNFDGETRTSMMRKALVFKP